MKTYLGIDVGSVTAKLAVLDAADELLVSLYLPTEGRPVAMVQQGLRQVRQQLPSGAEIRGVATTGSARYLAGAVVGADLVKNEITCQAVVRNYLSDVGSGKDIQPPVVFQGGVAFNRGIVRALREELNTEIVVPPHHEVMGAIGAAMLAHENPAVSRNGSRFRGFGISEIDYQTSSLECRACPTSCEVVRLSEDGRVVASWGGRCDLW